MVSTVKKFSLKSFHFFALVLTLIALLTLTVTLKSQPKNRSPSNGSASYQPTKPTPNPRVLAAESPLVYITNSGYGYSSSSLMAVPSTDSPTVEITGINYTGSLTINIYKANEDQLLNFLIHDKDNNQLKDKADTSSMEFVTSLQQNLVKSENSQNVLLPINNNGIFYLELKYASVTSGSFLVRSDNGVLAKEGDNQMIFWGQNFKTKRGISAGVVKLYNLTDSVSLLSTVSFNADGVAQAPVQAASDIAVVEQDSDVAVVPLNLHYLGYGRSFYHYFAPKTQDARYFIFTDRPLYKPGDTVYFKSVIRDDDDARYSIPQGSAKVTVYTDYSSQNKIFEKSYSISSLGTIDGNFSLPKDGKTGWYRLVVELSQNLSSENSFEVEYFRKPEYFLDVNTSSDQFVAHDQAAFQISGSYYSGLPLSNQKVSYTIYSGNFYEYEYQLDQAYQLSNDFRYGLWGGTTVTQGEVTLDSKGNANVTLPTTLPANLASDQVFSIEVNYDDGSGDPTFARKNVLIFAGEYDIYRQQTSSYYTTINHLLSLPVLLVSHRNTKVLGVPLTAKIHRINYMPYQDPNQKYPKYNKEEEDLPDLNATTNSSGSASFSFTPTKVGSYQITVSGSDGQGNIVSKVFYSYVGSENQAFYLDQYNQSGLTIQADQKQYKPDQVAHLTISSDISDRDIFLSLDRARVNRYQVVHMSGSVATLDLPLQTTDMPNIYASVTSFSPKALESNSTNLVVSADSKKIIVNITPDNKKYGPSDNVSLNIQTTDTAGNPVSSDVAVWAVDKALFQLVDNNTYQIFDSFWSQRSDQTSQANSLEGILTNGSEMGGCFDGDTLILMADGTSRPIDQVKVGDYILTKENDLSSKLVAAKVTSTKQAQESGYLVINNQLKVTPDHKLWVNKSWMEAALIKVGDSLTDSQNQQIKVNSLEWVRGKFTVYNLTVDKYNTFFAQNFYVHNQKGGGKSRTIFKDTAYWNPSVQTDSSGQAKISFKLPDNLTTWVISGISETADTRVGQNTTEIEVSKDIVIKPILPNILQTGDQITLSALVQNFTDTDQKFDVNLNFDSGEVEQASQSAILVKSKDLERVFWTVYPQKSNETAKLTFSTKSESSKQNSDTIVQTIPVRDFGFSETLAQTGDGPKTFQLKLDSDSLPAKTKVTLTLSPTMLGTLPQAMDYLVDYPYGCVEQTTSRFVPALIAKTYPNLFKEAMVDKDVDDIIRKGIVRLSNQQQSDGGWTWWFTGDSSPFITSYVLENLLQAKKLGFEIDDSVINSAQSYLETPNSKDSLADQVARNYGLTLLGSSKKKIIQDNLNSLTPDILSLAVISNYQNGNTNPASNGLTLLESKAKPIGDGVYWEGGDKIHFASNDASTALAIRAIVKTSSDKDLAVKGERYLMSQRNNNYWSSTYATSMVIQGLLDISTSLQELTPNYSYKVMLDGNMVSSGTVTDLSKINYNINIPANKIHPEGSSLEIIKDGDGQIYSTLLISQFHTDPNLAAAKHGLSITREYINDKGENYSLGIGDTVTVKLTVNGPAQSQNYGVITDQLPSGMIPINTAFKNQQYGENSNYLDYYNGSVWDNEYTENGVILSAYIINPGLHTYTYKARVVNSGVFKVPPATVSLMYSPEIYGRSQAETVTIDQESQIIPGKLLANPVARSNLVKNQNIILIAVLVILGMILIILSIFLIRRDRNIDSWRAQIRKLFKKDSS